SRASLRASSSVEGPNRVLQTDAPDTEIGAINKAESAPAQRERPLGLNAPAPSGDGLRRFFGRAVRGLPLPEGVPSGWRRFARAAPAPAPPARRLLRLPPPLPHTEDRPHEPSHRQRPRRPRGGGRRRHAGGRMPPAAKPGL